MLTLIKRNYFLLTSIFLIFYFAFNLVSGERGLFSYNDKKDLLSNLKKEELLLTNKIKDLDHKNSLLSTNLDLDYVETLIRERFLFGKEGETIYIINKNENNYKYLVDVELNILNKFKDSMNSRVYNRAKFVIEENKRTHDSSVEISKSN